MEGQGWLLAWILGEVVGEVNSNVTRLIPTIYLFYTIRGTSAAMQNITSIALQSNLLGGASGDDPASSWPNDSSPQAPRRGFFPRCFQAAFPPRCGR